MSLAENDIKTESETLNVEDILANCFLKKYDLECSESDNKDKKKSKHKKHKSRRRSDSSETVNVEDILANFFLEKCNLNFSNRSESDCKYTKSKHKHKSERSDSSETLNIEDILANFFLEKFNLKLSDSSENDSKYKKNSKHKHKSGRRSDSSERRNSNSMSIDCTSSSEENNIKRCQSTIRKRRLRSHSKKCHRSQRESKRRRESGSEREKHSPSRSYKIDQAKIREIAEKNLLIMIQQGTLPELILEYLKSKEIISIKGCGKSVQELTDFCVKLSKKENEVPDYVHDAKDVSNVKEENNLIRHPFKLKEQSVIKLNIKSAVQISIKTRIKKFPETAKLRCQFPVSSGNQHKQKELEWVPVVPKQNKSDLKQNEVKSVVPVESVAAPKTVIQESVNSCSMHVKPLPSDQLGGFKDNRVKKDQFTSAVPITEGKGMSLLKKMGWNPGEGLGKNKEGSLVPLIFDIKMDKKGLVSEGESEKGNATNAVKGLQGKHPVCALMEVCSKRKWKPPVYTIIKDVGPSHKKFFLFKVEVNGVDYKPALPSSNKKVAKVAATTVCLQALKVFPS